jgi:N-acyl-D-amino-acid deacylase
MPAARLALTNKGRLAAGADADITVFDPARVTDRATFDNPAQASEGIPYVIVNGVFVVKDSKVQPVVPGRAVRRVPSK